MNLWKLVEYKKVSEEEPTDDINKISKLQAVLNHQCKNEGLVYLIEKV